MTNVEDIEYRVKIDKKDAAKSLEELEKQFAKLDESITLSKTVASQSEIINSKLDDVANSIKKTADEATKADGAWNKWAVQIIAVNQALEIGKKVVRLVVDQMERARVVEQVTAGFESLQGGVENASAVLTKLEAAVDGTVTQMELMKAANQAVTLGLPIDQFDQLVASARRLGSTMGLTTLESIKVVTEGIGRQSFEVLNNIGVIVRAEEANKKYAESEGIVGRELSQTERQVAFTREAITQLTSKASETAEVANTTAVAYQRMTASIENARDRISTLASESEGLRVIFDFLAESADRFILGLNALADADGIERAALRLGQLRKEQQELTQSIAEASQGPSLGDLFSLASGKGIDEITRKNAESVQELTKRFTEVKKEIGEVEGFIKNYSKETAKQTEENAKGAETLAKKNEEVGKEKKLLEEMRKLQQQSIDLRLREEEELFKVIRGTSEYSDLMSELNSGTITNSEATDRLNLIYSDVSVTMSRLSKAKDDLIIGLAGVGDQGRATGDEMLNLVKRYENAETAAEGLTKSSKGLQDQLLEGLFGSDVEADVQKQFISALSGIDLADIRGSLPAIGSAAGTAVGSIFGPQGAAIGQELGAQIGEGLQNVGKSTEETISGIITAISPINFGLGDILGEQLGGFFGGGKSARDIARDNIDAFFEDALDANRLNLIIDGQLQEIKDVAENNVGGFFENLDLSTEQGFNQFGGFDAIGTAIAALTGDLDLLGSEFGAVLGNEFGGTLNNLQIALGELNISQEDLAGAIEEAWLAGDITATKYLSTLSNINNVYAKGIPDGVGLTLQSFNNLLESGGAGRQVMDALGDSAVEAQELGLGTLQALKADLIAKGADAEKVAKLFDALAKNGIDSLQELSNINVQTSAAIAAQLEGTGDFFLDIGENASQANEKVGDLNRNLDELNGKTVETNVVVRVRTEYQDNDARGSLGLVENGGPGQSA